MLSRNRELWWALVAIFIITLLYTGVVSILGSVPAARSFFGHSLGVIGFILMLMTETLYSLRKRARGVRWGKMASWLQFHIFSGLVGPYLVLLHTAWKFNGLAGVVFLLTIIIVISGFIGRYIYTAVPRTADGVELQARELGAQILRIEEELSQQVAAQPSETRLISQRLAALPSIQGNSAVTVLGRVFQELSYRVTWQREQRRLSPTSRAQLTQLERLAEQRRLMRRQMESLAMARRMLATWHTVHIPIGMALFIAAFVHIAGAVYYATLLH
jgi:hypothetical protein